MNQKSSSLKIQSARENNLKSVNLEIEHNKVTVVTGLSGSGKSSLAFDTVYAEGQRRYIETFSPYTRQFFDKIKKPDADNFENVRPAIAIQQRNRITNSRSTVGSLTNLNDYLKIIWFNLSAPHCFECGSELKAYDPKAVCEWIIEHSKNEKDSQLMIASIIEPSGLVTKKKSKANPLTELRESLLAAGFSRYFDTQQQKVCSIEELQQLDTRLLLVLDRLRFSSLPEKKQITDSLSQAFNLQVPNLPVNFKIKSACSLIKISNQQPAEINSYDFFCEPVCLKCNCQLPKLRQSLFSFNHPLGACSKCKGFGHVLEIDLDKVIPNKNFSLEQGAIQCWNGTGTTLEFKELKAFCKQESIDISVPWKELSEADKTKILTTKSKSYWGIYPWFKYLERKTYKMHVRVLLSRYRSQFVCSDCAGTRLTRPALAYKVSGKTLPEIWNLPVSELVAWLNMTELNFSKSSSWSKPLAEVFSALQARLQYLVDLGLPYLTLDRQARTLSGGETQRVNLANALGSDLVSTQFVLDEPSVGLHPKDTEKLIKAVHNLASKGNSLLVVEHDLDCISSADNIIELGPQAGNMGGEITFNGKSQDWPGIKLESSGTQPSGLSGGSETRAPKSLKILSASARNLKSFNIDIPLNKIVCLSGPSGSGKSSLVQEVIVKAYDQLQNGIEGYEKSVKGFSQIDKVLVVDQSPLTKSPRANIATYCGIWDKVRELLADTEEAGARGLDKSSFSFNVDAGRCAECKGAGFIKEDMQFLSDVYVTCESCLGHRFKTLVLEVKYNGKSVAELLKLSVDQALAFFSDQPAITESCSTLSLLGLGHLSIGHSLSELSGGEAQRLKLVPFVTEAGNTAIKSNASRKNKGSLLIFDEPTTGLHYKDTLRLIKLLNVLKENGHSILVIEHNLTLLSEADYLIDLGPVGGELGGYLLFEGHPSEFLSKEALKISDTAKYLKDYHELVKSKKILNSQNLRKSDNKPSYSFQDASCLILKGAKEHNLKNVDLTVPYGKMLAFCGVSGSGKSSIAKDIIYAEGQRRYLDCLSPYARQFIKELKKPEVDEVKNIKPTVCVYQHTFQPSRLSTVATMSEIYNFLRLLFCKVAAQHCPDHKNQEISSMTAADMLKEIKAINASSIRILAPLIKMKKGSHKAVFERARKLEVDQLRVDGIFLSLSDIDVAAGLAKSKVHSIDYVLAKFNPKTIPEDLLEQTINQALILGSGTLIVHYNNSEQIFSTERACPVCKKGFFKPDPEDLSFNSKRGRCQKCDGHGKDAKDNICKVCQGARISQYGLSLKISGFTIDKLSALSSLELVKFLELLEFKNISQSKLAAPILREIFSKAKMLIKIGLDYLPLNRDCATLSAGELQRLRLASAASSSLSGALFIFDEPSAGLHPKDNLKVISCLRELQQQGNSVIIIEHDQDSILACDYIIEVGPAGGRNGGQIIFEDSVDKFKIDPFSPTSRAFRDSSISFNKIDKSIINSRPKLKVREANCNFIKNLSLDIPLQSLVSIIGVSGAGKSSLLRGIILNTLIDGKQKDSIYFNSAGRVEAELEITKIVEVDQSPIGVNSRSTPASYLKIWDQIRELLSKTIEAEVRGWSAGFFSYNSGKGRCPTCQGLGQRKLEMSFLPDARVECESCEGLRFSAEALSVKYLGLNPYQILSLTFEEAKEIFANHAKIHRICHMACELGLGYLSLGQSSSTLSGGESQRIKLVSELNTVPKGHAIYILDEPTTGLHKSDVAKLVKILKQLVDRGNSVLVIEHDPALIMESDWVVEMGSGPASAGGRITYQGVPENYPH